MFDIVAADDDKLTLAVEIEGIDNAKPHLPRASAGHPQAAPEGKPEDEQDEHGGDKKRHRGGADHQRPVLDKQITQGLHGPTCLNASPHCLKLYHVGPNGARLRLING